MPRAPSLEVFSFVRAVGRWEVRRKMVDHRAGLTRFFEGTAVITPEGFEEKGRIRFGDTVLNATRSYRLQFEEQALQVQFPDGSDFVRLEGDGSPVVGHLCGADTYRGRFFFVDEDTWAEVWRVNGPQKCYASVSRYRRMH